MIVMQCSDEDKCDDVMTNKAAFLCFYSLSPQAFGTWLETHDNDDDDDDGDQVVMVTVMMMKMIRWRERPPLPPHRPGRGALTQSPTNREQTRSTNANLFLLEILLLIFS